MRVSHLGQERATCSYGYSNHLNFDTPCPPIASAKGQGFYVELFLKLAFPMEQMTWAFAREVSSVHIKLSLYYGFEIYNLEGYH